MTFDLAYALQCLPLILRGALVTFYATAAGMTLALVLALGFVLLGDSRSRIVRAPVRFLSLLLRGTPILVQLYFLYYVLPRYGISLGALATGITVLGLQYGAYVGEVYRAGIEDIGEGQWEAAHALGLSPFQTWIKIIIPQAIRRVLPPLGNYLISMFKSTPYLAAITVQEMLGAALDEASFSFRYLEPMLMAGLIFLILSCAASFGVRAMERAFPARV